MDELTLAEYEKLAVNSPWTKWINITGGEPTDRDDLELIVATFRKHCKKLCVVNFTTNGLRPDRIEQAVRAIAALKIPKVIVNVSIDGPPDVNDLLRGIPGDFSSAVDALKKLRQIPGITSRASMTLYPKNTDLIFETHQAIAEYIPHFKLNEIVINIPHNSSHFYGNQKVKLNKDIKIISALKKFNSELAFPRDFISLFKRAYFRYLPSYLETGKSPMSCPALMTSVYISEKGDLFPCTIWSKKVGSLRETNFDVLKSLRSPVATEAREMIKKLDCPNCWSPCEAFPSLMTNATKLIL